MIKKKKSTKKSFYFEDYNEEKISYSNNNFNIIKVSLNRVTFLSFIFFSLILIFAIKIFYISLSAEKNNYSNLETDPEKTRRNIIDRNNHWIL